jgi:hypothetical protein
MTAREQAAIEKLKTLHPDAVNVRVTKVTRKAIYVRYDCPKLGPLGLFVDLKGENNANVSR